MHAAPETRTDAPPDRITHRLALRAMRLSDAPFLAREGARPEVARMVARVPVPMPALSAEMFILIMQAREDAGLCQARLITRREDGAPMGVIGLHGRKQASRDLGYWLARDFWGHGFMSEAAAAMIDLARERGFTGLTAGHFADNPASGRVLEKLGFAYTDNGQTTTMYSIGRLASVPHRAMALPIGLKTG